MGTSDKVFKLFKMIVMLNCCRQTVCIIRSYLYAYLDLSQRRPFQNIHNDKSEITCKSPVVMCYHSYTYMYTYVVYWLLHTNVTYMI